MGTRTGRLTFSAVVLAAALFCVAYSQKRINDIRSEARLTDTNYIENAPPMVAFVTVALGSFRGLLADILWLRTLSLQEEGQYFEMVQLANWITELQPRFTGAISYLAWNMAYNISVTCSSFEDRWRWVNKGIELIRDRALKYNPGDPILYKELGWIYQHKIGNMMDDANLYYKNRMAMEMMRYFGGPKPDWRRLAEAPKTAAEVEERLGMDKKFWERLSKPGKDSKEAFRDMGDVEKAFRKSGEVPERVAEALGGRRSSKTGLLDDYLRAKWIREKLKLDPAYILKLNEKYGDLDWRLPEAHAIYWASKGIDNDAGKGKRNEFCERMITQSLHDAFMGGRLLLADPDNPATFSTIPNLSLGDAVYKAFKGAYERQKNDSFKAAMEYFLEDAVVMSYTFGKYSLAKKYFKLYRKEKPGDLSARLGLDRFVLSKWKDDARSASVRQMNAIVGELLYRSAYLAATGDHDGAEGHLNLAKGIYNLYKNEHIKTWKRVGLPPFDEMKREASKRCLMNLAEMKKMADEARAKLKGDREPGVGSNGETK